MPKLSIQFLGGAGTVTGSKYLVICGDKKILIDCGLFQGLKNLRLLNWSPMPFSPAEIDTVILTHAHLDHCGYLPLLVKEGFDGSIYCSEPTRALTEIILKDSAHLQEEDAEQANQEGYSKHKPALPLYTSQDVNRTLPRLKVANLHEWIHLSDNIKFKYSRSGHILGSVFVELDCEGKRIVFSGDLGRSNPLTLYPRERIETADYLLIESTYGDRKHSRENEFDKISKIIADTIQAGGQVLIPCFAVGRAQDVLHILSELRKLRKLPDVPVYLDSPMAIQTTKVFDQFSDWHKLRDQELAGLRDGVSLVSEGLRSKGLQKDHQPAIIIAGSGMLTGGRILGHAFSKLRDPKNTFILVGFQAAGTLGRFLKEGAEEVKMFGEYVPVRARIEELTTLSAHADQSEIIEWLNGFSNPPQKTFIVHGEPHAANALRVRIKDALGWDAVVPELGSFAPLD